MFTFADTENDVMPWLRTSVGWIPERLPGQRIGLYSTPFPAVTDSTPFEGR